MKGFQLLQCAIQIYSKYVWAVPLKDNKGIAITNAFPKIFNEPSCKLNKTRANKRSEFYNKSNKSWLKNINIEMYSICCYRKIYWNLKE